MALNNVTDGNSYIEKVKAALDMKPFYAYAQKVMASGATLSSSTSSSSDSESESDDEDSNSEERSYSKPLVVYFGVISHA